MRLGRQRLLESLAGPPTLEGLLRGRPTPIVDGREATFVFEGVADEVKLKHWIFGLASEIPFERLDGTNLWTLSIDVPEHSRIEYKLLVRHGANWSLLRDPLNPVVAHDPYGANSVCQADGYAFPEWAQHDPDARPGTLVDLRVHSRAFGDDRLVQVYVPARLRARRRHPVLIVHDGPDYVRFAALKVVLDNLIERHEIPRIIVALTHSRDRLREYAADERHAAFLVDDLLPALESAFPIENEPAGRGLVGASFGAVAALSTAWRRPDVFGRLLLQSGSFAFTDIGDENPRGPLFAPVVQFMNRFRAEPGRPAERMFVSCGVYESLIYENRSLVPFLQSAGIEVRYREARDGHNWENWRDRLREGLAWLFPGPLWMVYE